MKDRAAELWDRYHTGRQFNSTRTPDQYTLVKTNREFFTGNQWLNLPDTPAMQKLPKPTFNIIKRIVSLFVASLTSSNAHISFSSLMPDAGVPAQLATLEVRNLCEKFNMDYRIRDALYDGAISGDYCAHFWWDPEATPYGGSFGPYKGEIKMELVDGINVIFGNPLISDIERQPWVMIVGRQWRGQESVLDRRERDEDLYLLVYEKVDGQILVTKVTRTGLDSNFNQRNTELTRYPVCWANWEKQKNNYHGRALVTGIVPNQIYINTMMAMVFRNMLTQSFSKVIYNADILPVWNNEIGSAIGVHNLPPGYDLNQVATVMKPPELSDSILYSVDKAMEYTRDCLGATDVQLGQTNLDNTSALVLLQNSSAVPLGNIRAGLHEWVEDIGAVLLDMMGAYYGERMIATASGPVKYDFSNFKKLWFSVSADIGDMNITSPEANATAVNPSVSGQAADSSP